ncbi:alpha-xylosidase [Blautia pseudococcoides]|uniref:alpha-xylosidase n=1 Tax=Blautia pseudococcoides TaxID=1796616 RepID=UPI00148B29D5|nr:alpha-xylosidase [Blautia pseudococcoides]QJU17220.1 alpha-xylosidase [Blautia pseudococcoides]
MKFSNGCWLQKEGCECFAPQQVYYVKKEQKRVVICAPTTRIRHRGDTLGGINLNLEITSPMPEVLRVRICHHKGVRRTGPEFELEAGETVDLDVREEEETIRISSGTLCLVLTKENWSMTYERRGEALSKSSGRDLAYMKTDWKGYAYDKGSQDAYMRQQLGLSVGELVYGLGERFTPFIKNGQSVDIWNEDGGTSTEQSYKNIPFYLTNRGYGVFVNHPEKVSFEVGTEQVSKVEFSVPGEYLDYFFINGPSMKEVLERYTGLTGKPSLPPKWTFGLWLSTSFTTDYDEETVMSFIDGMEERGIPLQVFHFDCFWMKEFHWSDFVWDSRVFPDPKGMLSRIKERGLKICVWINPYIAEESCLFEEGMDKGYLVERENGDVWQWDMWQPGMALVDFTNPRACRWYQEKLESLLDMGVDCFKTDFGERIPTEGIRYYDGSDPVKMHNFYTYLYNKTVYELLQKKRGAQDAVLFARSATVGGQKFPVHWGGDCWSSYEAMAESLRGGLSLTMSGFGYWSHDIGGFESTSTPDVYKRWAAFGLLSSHSRLHGSTSYRVPWAYDEESVEVLRRFTKLKLELLPYLCSSACDTARTGIPMMRSMVLEFEQDPACYYLDRQYMLGEKLLAAPVFGEDGEVSYYLPQGTWTNYLTGETAPGGIWRKERHGYDSIPLWVRENSILPTACRLVRAADSYAENMELKVYELQGKAGTVVYEDGKEVFRMTIEQKKETILCRVTARGSFRIRFLNRAFSSVSGGVLIQDGRDCVIEAKEPSVIISI